MILVRTRGHVAGFESRRTVVDGNPQFRTATTACVLIPAARTQIPSCDSLIRLCLRIKMLVTGMDVRAAAIFGAVNMRSIQNMRQIMQNWNKMLIHAERHELHFHQAGQSLTRPSLNCHLRITHRGAPCRPNVAGGNVSSCAADEPPKSSTISSPKTEIAQQAVERRSHA